ncbi:MAG: DNA mismatch repair endonuclease MutL [Nitrospirales bacterium]|nr:DNA mismatch repair endonuclease MutL [Nitrospirales bacterium]
MHSPAQGKIQVLPDDVSCRIAAGEVVERPASVVKELLENSLDAGSTLITIEVEEGGRRLIRIIDNGEGMSRSDAQLSCQRFATSKLRHENDLHHLNTLGFRGEALPSIASISRFRLKTIPPDSPVGTETSSIGGTTWDIQDFAGTRGTEIEVRDVFFNTPGRLKFLKSVPTEFSKICYVVQQAALVNPTVHFRLFHQGNKVFEYPTATTTQDRLLQVYGTAFLERYVPLAHQSQGVQLAGFTVSPHFARNTRSPQEIFVNRRAVKNSTIAHAIQEGYGSFLPKGRQPQYILFLTLDPDSLDVNVHPTKREVRFSRPEIIHSGIRQAIKNVFFEAPTQKTFLRETPEITLTEPVTSRGLKPSFWSPASSNTRSAGHSPTSTPTGRALSLLVQEPTTPYASPEQPCSIYPLGQIHHTYLLGQIDDDLYIIDQHTAHERVLFERLLRNWANRELSQQGLLIPEPLELPPHQQSQLEEWLPTFEKVGLQIERFGQTAYVVRSVPSILGSVSVGPLVMELLEELTEWRSQDSLEKALRPIFATMACQCAVQAGRAMSHPEIHTLLQDWAQERFPMTCPHGRRIALRHSVQELQTLFARPT